MTDPNRPKNRRGPVTQKQIAESLGLSRAVVSYVLNGKDKENGISEETARLVREALAETGYRPNAFARTLKGVRTSTIGILAASFQMDWVHRLHLGMQRVLDDSEYTPLFVTHGWDPARERKEIEWLLDRQVDGLILAPPLPENRDFYEQLMREHRPLLFFSDTIPNMREENYVVWDSTESVKTVVRHMFDSGCRRIAFFGHGGDTLLPHGRLQAYRDVLAERGRQVEDRLVFAPHVREMFMAKKDWRETFREFFFPEDAPWPDGVMVINDAIAEGLVGYLCEEGVRIPEEISVAGLGDLPLMLPQRHRLTTVREPMRRMGELAARAMLRLIEEPEAGPVQEWVTCNELVQGTTTRPLGARETAGQDPALLGEK